MVAEEEVEIAAVEVIVDLLRACNFSSLIELKRAVM